MGSFYQELLLRCYEEGIGKFETEQNLRNGINQEVLQVMFM